MHLIIECDQKRVATDVSETGDHTIAKLGFDSPKTSGADIRYIMAETAEYTASSLGAELIVKPALQMNASAQTIGERIRRSVYASSSERGAAQLLEAQLRHEKG